MATVKLKLRRTLQDEFLVTLTVKNLDEETEGFLPPLLPELASSFNQWQLAYRQIEDVRSCIAPAPGLRLTPKNIINYSQAEHTLAVKDYLNQWLNSGDSRWQPIRDSLIAIADKLHSSNKEIRVIIDAKDIDLRRLPWQEWNLFEEYYPQTEIAFSATKSLNRQKNELVSKSTSVRILVAVGRSNGINTQDDLKVIQELKKDGVEVDCLMQPNRQDLCEALWNEKGYHIFVFTGHSGSQEDGQIGWIELNDKDSLSIEEFKEALKQAIHKGLQLAIFNSCDGLGLANQLAQLHLPQMIVMREPVPDRVAVDFIKYFFREFSHNNSLFTSVQKARKRLEHFKSDYPGAIWLPTICIEPNVEPLTWQELHTSPQKEPIFDEPDKSTPKPQKNLKPWLLTGLIGVIVGGVYFGWNQVFLSPPSGKFRYGGSTSWAPITSLVEQKIKEKWPQFELNYYNHPTLPPGSGTGIKMLLDSQIAFAESSRSVSDQESIRANIKGVKLKQVRVAIDIVAIVVHPSLNIPGLSVEQFKGIYTGKITNWQQVGGPNLKITPYSRPHDNSGTTEFVKNNILGADNFGTDIKFISTTTQALTQVGQNLNHGGIYYASASEVINQCSVRTVPIILGADKVISVDKPGSVPGIKCPWQNNKLNSNALKNNEYPISRYLYVILRKDGQEDEKAGEFFANYLLTDEGQDLIEKANFLPIR